MKQLKYSFEDLLKNKIRYLIITFQILVSLVLINIFFSNTLNLYNFSQEISTLKNSENFYLLYDKTDNSTAHQIVADNNNFIKIKELTDFIYNNELFETYLMTDIFDTVVLNDNYLKLLNFEFKSGANFSKSDFIENPTLSPVIIGYNLGKKYKVGDLISDAIGNEYKVKGILKKGEFRLDLKATSVPISLDNSIIKPLEYEKNQNIPYYDMALHSTIIKTDNIENLNLIIDKSNELGLFNYHFKDFQKHISEIEESHKKTFILYLFLTSLILIFLFITLYSTIIQYIEKYTFEFSIHVLCGATYIDLFKRMVFQISFMFFVANLINVFLFPPQNMSYVVNFSILAIFISSLIIYFKIKNNKLLTLVKEV